MPSWPLAPALLLLPVAHVVNVVLTFWGALGFALLAARCAPWPTLRKFVLLLPFVKLAHELWAGIPADNYTLGPYAGTRWELGRYLLGVGWPTGQILPGLELHLGALHSDRWHSLSGGDLLATALFHRGAWPVLALAVIVALGVAAERAADAAAVRRGANPTALASALVRAAEYRCSGMSVANAAGRSATARRVRALLSDDAAPSHVGAALLAVLTLVIALVAMHSSFFGFR